MSDQSSHQDLFFTGGRLSRRRVFPLAGGAAAAAVFGPAALAGAQGYGTPELRTSQSGSLAGNPGGAYATYQISSPGGSAVNLTLTYNPLMGSLGNGVSLEAYQTGGKLGSATDSLGSGTVTLSITPVTGSAATVKVGNYIGGVTINYTLASSAGAAAGAPATAAPSAGPSAAQARYVYVGTYTAPNTAPGGKVPSTAQGIYVFKMDPATGGLTPVQIVTNIPNPSWVTTDSQMRYLYASSEVSTWKGQANTGGITAFSIDPASGKLTPLNDQPSMGAIPAHMTVDPSSKYLLVANYVGATYAVLPIKSDGSLGAATDVFTVTGKGPNTGRQEAPHPHMILFDPANDKVWSWKLDAAAGKLVPNTIPYVQVASGSGPRHSAFHPGGKFAYVISEMASSITAFAYDSAHGTMIWVQTVSTLPPDFTGSSACAELIMHPSGKWVYGSNRGHDTIAAFAIDQTSGKLTPAGWTSTQGNIPRGFTIDPSGSLLLAGNQNSDSIVPFRIDPNTGALSPTGATTSTPVPVSFAFSRPIGS